MQRLGAVAAVAIGFKRNVQLMDQGQPRQAKFHAPAFVEDDAHVFDKMLDEETRGEIVGDDPRGEIRKRPTAGRAGSTDCRTLSRSSPAL